MKEKPNGHSNPHPQPLCVTVILDESGSMQSCKGAAIAGFNHYVATLRQEPADTRLTLILFNSGKIEAHYQMSPVADVQDLDVETYRPADTTPLYDAIGRTLSTARREAHTETRQLCVILTDGLENASTEYTRTQVFGMIDACKQQGWTFLYLGADHDVWAAGESLGIAGGNRVAFSKRNIGETFTNLSESTARYRRSTLGAEPASFMSGEIGRSDEKQQRDQGSRPI